VITTSETRRRNRGIERGTTSAAAVPVPHRTVTAATPHLHAARPRLSSGPGGGAPEAGTDRRIGDFWQRLSD